MTENVKKIIIEPVLSVADETRNMSKHDISGWDDVFEADFMNDYVVEADPVQVLSAEPTIIMPVVEVDNPADNYDDRYGAQKAKKAFLIAAGAGALVLTALFLTNDGNAAEKVETPEQSAPNDGSDVTGGQEQNFRDGLGDVFVGFDESDLAIGKAVNFNANPEERGDNSFVTETLRSQEDIKTYLASDNPAAKATVADLKETFKDDPAGLVSALNGEAFVPVQVHRAAVVKGNTYFKNGKAYFSEKDRPVLPGDVFWFYVKPDGTIVRDASIRADCANVRLVIVVPQKDTPRTPTTEDDTTETTRRRTSTSTTTPSSTSSTRPGSSTTLKPKDPSRDYNVSPTTSPNQGPGSGGRPGPEGRTSTTERRPDNSGNTTTTIDAEEGDPTPTTGPAGECGPACD